MKVEWFIVFVCAALLRKADGSEKVPDGNCLMDEDIGQKPRSARILSSVCAAEMQSDFSAELGGNEDELPSKCYNPHGNDCSWYTECLERKHRCDGTPDGYAIEFADKYCNLFGVKFFRFSEKGQRWVNAVRKCLQLALSPTIRRTYVGDCPDIKEIGFQSHIKCYLSPAPGEPSFCDLNPLDWGNTFWIVKSSLLSKDWRYLSWEMAKVGSICISSKLVNVILLVDLLVVWGTVMMIFGCSLFTRRRS